MKKMMALLLTGVMALSMLTACGSSSTETEATTEATTEEATEETAEEATEEAATYSADVQDIIDRGVLRVGVKADVSGFGFQDALTGEYTGMEIELAALIADYLGVDIEYTAVTAATRGELLNDGSIDCVLATFTITDERRETWDFTTAYYTDAVTVLVEDASGITDLSGLVGTTVGVSSGSTSAKALVAAMIEAGVVDGTDYDAETFDAATWTEGVTFLQYADYPSISTALSAGEVSSFCVDKSILSYYKTEGRSYIEDNFSPQEYGICTTLDSEMSDLCEELVTTWLADGTIDALIVSNGIE